MLWALVMIALSIVASNVVFGLRKEVERVRRLGQYTLDEKIGEGAMGVVYRARHAMLRRPTAIKLLPPQRMGQKHLQRFEREVQLTAMLTHPNTVAIYDYGRTPDGVFYYAMEFLDGINLEDLVRRYGAQPDGRVIAHPAAGVPGAGRSARPRRDPSRHQAGQHHPDGPRRRARRREGRRLRAGEGARYERRIADAIGRCAICWSARRSTCRRKRSRRPTAIDARSDLYALGAVGYFLVTGQPLFEGRTIMELCAHHLHTAPIPPSVRLGRPVDRQLEAVLMSCLEKDPAHRPLTALAVHDALAASDAASEWSTGGCAAMVGVVSAGRARDDRSPVGGRDYCGRPGGEVS